MRKHWKILALSIFTFSLFIVLYKYSVEAFSSYRENIVKDFSKVIGELNYVSDGGEASPMKLEYKYLVNYIECRRRIPVKFEYRHHFRGCLNSYSKCRNIGFWVIYSNNNPENSLVDIHHHFIEEEQQEFPGSLKHFEKFLVMPSLQVMA